jgi:hypothetical protein
MADRETLILKHAAQGDLEVVWTPLTVGGRIELLVTSDAVKLGGVRINVSATCQQRLADLFGALLLTPKVVDLIYAARAITIDPLTMPITSSTAAMVKESQRQDAAISTAGGVETGGIVGTLAKHWCIDNSLLQHAGMAENYGWMKPAGTKSPWAGIAIYPSVTLTAMVIQQPSWAHDPSHSDYSQQCCLMHRACKVDGVDADLAAVLQDATLGPMLSHNGPLQAAALRQPGVALYACSSKAAMRVVDAATAGSTSSNLCPMPPPPSNIVTPGGWKPYAFLGAVAVATATAYWWYFVRR